MFESDNAGFWQRGVAFLIDKTILFFTSAALFLTGMLGLTLCFNSPLYELYTNTRLAGSFLIVCYMATTVIDVLYFTYFHGTTGQTIGKKILGIKVVQSTGRPMTLGIAFLRWVGYIISGLVFYLGYIWIAFDERKQGWHDKIASTCVIKVKPCSKMLDKIDEIR